MLQLPQLWRMERMMMMRRRLRMEMSLSQNQCNYVPCSLLCIEILL